MSVYKGSTKICGGGVPDYSKTVTLTWSTTFTNDGQTKTMTEDGWFEAIYQIADSKFGALYFYVNGLLHAVVGGESSFASGIYWETVNFPVAKGDVVGIFAEKGFPVTAQIFISRFTPFK